MIRKALTLFFSIAFFFCVHASAQTVDELIKKNLDARGGLQKIKAVKTTRVTAKVIQQSLEIPLVIQLKRPSMVRADVTFQGKSQIMAFNGQSGWKVDPFQGSPDPEKIAGDDLKEAEEQADMDGALVDYKEKGHKVELVGKEDMEGTPVYNLKLTLKNGDVRNIYLDAENYLELKIKLKRKAPGGEVEIEQYAGNYKPVNRIMHAFSVETKVKGQTVNQIVIEKIEMDVPIDDSVFKMPEKPAQPPKPEEKKPPLNL